MELALLLVTFVVTLALGVPVAICLALASLAYMLAAGLPSTDRTLAHELGHIVFRHEGEPATDVLLEAAVSHVPAGSSKVRIEELLEAQYNGHQTIAILDRALIFDVNQLVQWINKKFYA